MGTRVMLQRLETFLWELFVVSWRGNHEPQVCRRAWRNLQQFQADLNQKSGNCCVLEEEAGGEWSWSLQAAGHSFWADPGGGDTSLARTEQGSPRCPSWPCHGVNQFPCAIVQI